MSRSRAMKVAAVADVVRVVKARAAAVAGDVIVAVTAAAVDAIAAEIGIATGIATVAVSAKPAAAKAQAANIVTATAGVIATVSRAAPVNIATVNRVGTNRMQAAETVRSPPMDRVANCAQPRDASNSSAAEIRARVDATVAAAAVSNHVTNNVAAPRRPAWWRTSRSAKRSADSSRSSSAGNRSTLPGQGPNDYSVQENVFTI